MPDNYLEYETDCENIREENAVLLSKFESWLTATGLSKTTITTHSRNIDFYINEYLLYEDATTAADGCYDVNGFLGDWFIRKASWSSASSIRGNAASLKKFYTFMQEDGLVEAGDLVELNNTIQNGIEDWLNRLDQYEDQCRND